MECEVLIVGAGPAGSATAAGLARQGHDVLLLDRASFPRDKSCGDGVPAPGMEVLYQLGMKDRIESAVAEGGFHPLKSMLLVSPGGYEVQGEFSSGADGAESYIVPRLLFDEVVLNGALDAGARFMQAHARDVILEDGGVVGVVAKVEGVLQEIRAKVVIGADGVGSVVARRLRGGNEHADFHRAAALRAYIDGFHEYPNRVEFYLPEEILPGYAWIFPMGNGRANIGIGARLDVIKEKRLDLKQMLGDFLEMPLVSDRFDAGATPQDLLTWLLNFGSQPVSTNQPPQRPFHIIRVNDG